MKIWRTADEAGFVTSWRFCKLYANSQGESNLSYLWPSGNKLQQRYEKTFALPFYLMVDDGGLFIFEIDNTTTHLYLESEYIYLSKFNNILKSTVHANVNEEAFSKL